MTEASNTTAPAPAPASTPVQPVGGTGTGLPKGPLPDHTAGAAPAQTPKTLGNTDVNGAAANVSDLKVFGDGDTFKLICKASSQKEGWMKSTKACEVMGIGCMVQVTTQQRNPDGSYAVAEALAFFPGVRIEEEIDPNSVGPKSIVLGRKLVQY